MGRFLRLCLLAAVAAPSFAAPAPVAAAATPRAAGVRTATPGGTWTWQNPSPNGNPLFAVSCPSTSTCYAAGYDGPVLKTTNGGTSWTELQHVSGLFGLSCASTSMCVAVGFGGDVLVTNDGGASWAEQTLSSGADLNGVSCRTTTYCVAVGAGGFYATSTDGAVSWDQQVLSGHQDLYGVSCTSSRCYVAGVNFVGSVNPSGGFWGGSTFYGISCSSDSQCMAVGQAGAVAWMSSPTSWTGGVAGTVDLEAVSCPTATSCFAAGADGNVHVGTIASPSVTPKWSFGSAAEPGSLWSVSCPDASHCFVAGDYSIVSATTNSGSGWIAQTAPQQPNYMHGVSCSSAASCTAVGDGGTIEFSNSLGTNFQLVANSDKRDLYDISCPTDSMCLIGGVGGGLLKTAGGTSTPVVEDSHTTDPITSISCPGATTCYASMGGSLDGGRVIVSTDGGSTWSDPIDVDPNIGAQITGISCPSSTVCFAADNFGLVWATRNGGAGWSLVFSLSGNPMGDASGPFFAIDCPTTYACYAAGKTIATMQDGSNWRTDFTSSEYIRAMRCLQTSMCYATSDDGSVLKTTDSGASWEAQYSGSAEPKHGLACLNTTTCVAIGGTASVSQTTVGGEGWTRQMPSGIVSSINSISCPDASDCYVANIAGPDHSGFLATHDGGATWSASQSSDDDIIDSISCPTLATCFASGWPGVVYRTTDGGATWLRWAYLLTGPDETLISISCPSVSVCFAVGTGGHIAYTPNGGSTWSPMPSGTSATLFSVSCAATNFCVAVGAGGVALSFNGASWQWHPSGTSADLNGVSCPGSNTCVAVGDGGTVLVTPDGGATWSSRTSSVTEDLFGIQCASTTACLVAGASGTVLHTIDGSSWSADNLGIFSTLHAVAFVSPGRAWVAGRGGSIIANPDLFHLCLGAAISSSQSSPQLPGVSITFTASAGGGCNPVYQFWVLPPGGSWTMVQDFSTSSTWTWNTSGLSPGSYAISVHVRDAASVGAIGVPPNTYDSAATETFALKTVPCTGVGISPAPSSPQLAGTPVVFTASAPVCFNPLYEFWMRSATSTTWKIVQSYSTKATYSWNTIGTPGSFYISVWAKASTSSTASFESNATTLYTLQPGVCRSGSITFPGAPLSPSALAGTTVTFTASAQCTSSSPLYEFWLRSAAPFSPWRLVRAYSTSNSFAWNTSGLSGSFYVSVWVKDPASSTTTFDTNATTLFLVLNEFCQSVTITATPNAVSHLAGAHSTVSANTGCMHPVFEFWIRPANSATWTIVQAYSFSATYDFDSTNRAAGTYYVSVWVRDTASTKTTFDANATTTIQVT